MTRLLVLSDLHLEQSDWRFPESYPPFDVAVIPGDVSTPLLRSIETLARARERGGPLSGGELILVPGNHEFYHADMPDQIERGRHAAAYAGITLLDGDEVVLDGTRFLGATLWTDYDLYGDPAAGMDAARYSMNDHRLIINGGRLFAPEDALAIHVRQRAWLAGKLDIPHVGATVVVTHHCPSPQSVHRRFAGDSLNPAFASNLESLMGDNGPDLWLHGHTHHSFDYVVGRTRVVCNPKGYGPRGRAVAENHAEYVPDMVIEVGVDG